LLIRNSTSLSLNSSEVPKSTTSLFLLNQEGMEQADLLNETGQFFHYLLIHCLTELVLAHLGAVASHLFDLHPDLLPLLYQPPGFSTSWGLLSQPKSRGLDFIPEMG